MTLTVRFLNLEQTCSIPGRTDAVSEFNEAHEAPSAVAELHIPAHRSQNRADIIVQNKS